MTGAPHLHGSRAHAQVPLDVGLVDHDVLLPGGLLAARPWQLLVKRALDITGSILLLVLLAPVLAVTALAVAASSPGPIFYRQSRVGQHGIPFRMLKFRSMYRDADQRLEELQSLNECSGPVFKLRNDPRVTPVGRLIRRFSIDELPQLWNVLRGQMSLVGPRPPLPAETELYGPRELQRLLARPGLTCSWQVAGRSDVPFDQWVGMDLAYISDWTLWLDIKLLLMTIPAVLLGRGAY